MNDSIAAQKLSSPIDLIKRSVSIFFERKNLVYFLKIYAFLLPFTVFSLIQDRFFDFSAQDASDPTQFFSKYAWMILPAVIIAIAGLVFSFWVRVAGIFAIDKVVSGMVLPIKETFGTAWKMLFKFSLLDIILGMVTVIGFILLIIPGFIFLIWFLFSEFELVTKGTGIRQSMSNSKKLVSGRFWAVTGRLLVFFLFMSLISIILSLMPFGIGSVLNTLGGPLFAIPFFLLYKELSSTTQLV
jgi:hypothetical protein